MKKLEKIRKIGIPRAISYYNNFPFYYGFFRELGLDVIVSDETTAKTVAAGSKLVVSDTCFPIKVYVGHVVNLLEQGCDAIFVPALQSVAYKINNCSKIRGLAEIIRNIVKTKFLMVEPTLDKTEGVMFSDFCTDCAKSVGVADKKLVKRAISAGWKMYNNFFEMTNSGIEYHKAMEYAISGLFVREPAKEKNKDYKLSVVVTAHGYNLFDERISLNLLKKLEKAGVRAYTFADITRDKALQAIKDIGEFQYWANEHELTGTAAYFMLHGKIDGVIALSAFGCGPDSLMTDEIMTHCENRNLPFMHLTVDEHTGEAGFVTRLEAFVDMLERKKRHLSVNEGLRFERHPEKEPAVNG